MMLSNLSVSLLDSIIPFVCLRNMSIELTWELICTKKKKYEQKVFKNLTNIKEDKYTDPFCPDI